MRKEEGRGQAIAHLCVRRAALASDPENDSCRNYLNSNRHTPQLYRLVTYSKQTAAAGSNRHKFGGTLFLRAYPLTHCVGGNFLTWAPPLLYICRVLEETGSLRLASYRRRSRGAGVVGAGIGNGFKDSSYSSVQKLSLKILAGVSLPGIFASPHPGNFCGRSARPHTEEAA
jgi:hypothetical protein